MLQLVEHPGQKVISANKLEDGEVAIVVDCGPCTDNVGRIVQPFHNDLFTLGATSLHKWPKYRSLPNTFQVRVLPKGAIFKLV